MVVRFMVASILALTVVAVPVLFPRKARVGTPSSEVVSLVKIPAPSTSLGAGAPAAPAVRTVSITSADPRVAWSAFLVCQAFHLPQPLDVRARLMGAFFDGHLDEAAAWVRRSLEVMPADEVLEQARAARNLDRSIVLMKSAPMTVVRYFVIKAEDAQAHLEAVRVLAPQISNLVKDRTLGHAAFALLKAAGAVTPEAIPAVVDRVGADEWARLETAGLGMAAVPALKAALSSEDPALRSAAAWMLAVVVGDSSADRVVRAAVPEFRRDQVMGNAGFAVRALAALGEKGRPVARILLRSTDDQVVACAIDVLRRIGAVTAEEVDLAQPALDRLAGTPGVDEACIAIDAKTAIGAGSGARNVKSPPETLEPAHAKTSGREY